MPTPFSPAMDPYIERTGIWRDFHHGLIAAIQEQLNQRLPKGYVATVEESIRLTPADDLETGPVPPAGQQKRHPDVFVTGRGRVLGEGEGAIATLEAVEVEVSPQMIETTETSIEVIQLPERELVTTIEVLSPANKRGPSRAEYLGKRRESWANFTNLLEIDLLLHGRRLEPEEAMSPVGSGYCAVLSRASALPKVRIFNWPMRNPLPRLVVPLREPDPDVALDLVPLVDLVYQRGRYADLLRYDDEFKPARPPEPAS